MRTTAPAAAASSPACCADHVCGRGGPGAGLWAGPPAGGRAGPRLRRDARTAPEPEAALAGLSAGPAVLAVRHRRPVRFHPAAGRRARAHLPYGRGGAGRRAVFPHPQPAGAARAALAGCAGPGTVAAGHRPCPPGGAVDKKIFEKSKKPLPKLAQLV